MSSNLIKVKIRECGYDDFSLKDIGFTIEKNEFVGIIGPNGSGKTTLLRALSGVLKIKEGGISFSGENLAALSRKEIARNIAVVRQNELTSSMTLEEYILLGRVPHYSSFQILENSYDLDISHRAMDISGIFPMKDKLLEEVSAGERQLATIARALAQEPKLLLLDEPTSHLDIGHQTIILNLIKKLHYEKNFSVVAVLHDLNLAASYCDRLIVLKNGLIRSIGTPSEILNTSLINEVYETQVKVAKDPFSNTPHVFLRPEHSQ
jgi:iron complex transport system ATP-binding protein